MKTIFDVLRHPLVIGAFVLSILIVVGVYFGFHRYYGLVEPVDIPDSSAPPPPPSKNLSSSEIDLSGLQGEPSQTESTPTVSSVVGESVDDFLADLSDEEKALLTAEGVDAPQRISPFGFGPYPKVPSDFPHEPIWDEYIDTKNASGGSEMMRAMELIDRVLIELWTQGRHAFSGLLGDDDLVLPLYPDTVDVEWDYTEEPDGTMTRYASELTSGPDVPESVFDAIEEGTIPFGITVLNHDDHKINPFTFLNLNQ